MVTFQIVAILIDRNASATAKYTITESPINNSCIRGIQHYSQRGKQESDGVRKCFVSLSCRAG
ncbi:hypothetical protein [Agriterribacter sp.]|uniref:hypothetical protein n=1 Tax=Agriterribacter sp. TaxID=2821509 RepID=UPI002BCF98BA|nr:hypothetical protein [Agriterribacter sp.]HTN05469.1 hypothetical protein [Agriterribacter sp.]